MAAHDTNFGNPFALQRVLLLPPFGWGTRGNHMIRERSTKVIFFALLFAIFGIARTFTPDAAIGQSTIATGSIQGTILDSSGGGIPSAKVSILNKKTRTHFS